MSILSRTRWAAEIDRTGYLPSDLRGDLPITPWERLELRMATALFLLLCWQTR